MNSDNLGPGPDLADIDFSKMDRGDDPASKAAESPEPTLDEMKQEVEKAVVEEGEEAKESQEVDESQSGDKEVARDEQGKFKKKTREIPDHIPRDRFNEAVEKERTAKAAAEKRAAELEQQLMNKEYNDKAQVSRSEQVQQLDTRIVELEEQRDKCLLDGDQAKATALGKELRELNRYVARLEAQEESSTIVSQTLERERLNVTIARVEADFPELNPKSEAFDEELVDNVLMLQEGLLRRGHAPSQAMVLAVERTMKRRTQAATENSAEETGLARAKEQADERKKDQMTKAIATRNSQPPITATLGMDSDKAGAKALPNVTGMSADEYGALPESTRARLRGDAL